MKDLSRQIFDYDDNLRSLFLDSQREDLDVLNHLLFFSVEGDRNGNQILMENRREENRRVIFKAVIQVDVHIPFYD